MWIEPALLVAALTAFAYIWAFEYATGFAHYYGLAPEFVRVTNEWLAFIALFVALPLLLSLVLPPLVVAVGVAIGVFVLVWSLSPASGMQLISGVAVSLVLGVTAS